MTTFRDLRVLSKMPSFFVNHATRVGDHLPGPQGAVGNAVFLNHTFRGLRVLSKMADDSKMTSKPGLVGSDEVRKRVFFLKGSSASHCVLTGYLFSHVDLV